MLSQDEKDLLVYGHISIIQVVLRACIRSTTEAHLLTKLGAAQVSAKEIEGLVYPDAKL